MSAPPRSGARKETLVAALVLSALGLAVCWTSLENPFVLDDLSKIVGNPDIRDLSGLPGKLVYPYSDYQILERNDPSRPIVFLTFALNYALGKLEPFGYHLFNTLLHILNAFFVFLLSRRLFGERADRLVAPLAVALLFLCAPLTLGTVIYVYGRSDVMGSTFLLAVVLLYLRRTRASYAAALACFVLALFTKQAAVVAPVLCVAADAATRDGGSWREAAGEWRRYVPFVLAAGAYLGYRLLYFGAVGDMEGRGNTWPIGDYATVQPYVVARYLQLLFAPVGLSIDHQLLPATVSPAERVLGVVFVLALAALLVFSLRRAPRLGRGSLVSLVAFGASWFLVCLAPTSSVLPTVDAMVERRAYLASFGALVAAVAVALRYLRGPRLRLALFLVVVLAFAGVSVMRSYVHADEKRLWTDVLRVYPKSVRATNNLANRLLEEKRYTEAKKLFEQLIDWAPSDYIAHNNLGNLLSREDTPLRDDAKAAEHLLKAISLNAGYAAPHYNVGRIFQQSGNALLAEKHYLRALEIQPAYALAHNNLGLLYFHQNRRAQAQHRYEAALRVDPECAPAKFNLDLLARTPIDVVPQPPAPRPPAGSRAVPLEQVPSALIARLYEDALKREPHNKVVLRKYADLCRARKLPCARAQYEKLLRLEPQNTEIQRILRGL